MADAEVRRLLASDARDAFECGNPGVDRFLRDHVHANEFKYKACATYVVVDGVRVVAFATVVPASIDPRALGRERRGLPGYPQPVLRLAQFGTDRAFAGMGYGTRLMHRVFACAHALAQDYGCIGVTLDAVTGKASYYERFGFAMLGAHATPDGTTPMFLPLRKIPK